MPDVEMLIELADFYDVEIREIIDGERKSKSENMDKENKDTLKKVAEYSNKLLIKKIVKGAIEGILVFIVVYLILNIWQIPSCQIDS